jgi:hypothetical protein
MRNDLYAVNVVVEYGYAGNDKYGWAAVLKWQGGNFAETGYLEGEIRTRYYEETLTNAIDYVVEAKKQFGLKDSLLGIALLYEGDGEDEENPPPPKFKEILKIEADNRNWKSYHNFSI